MPTLLVNDIELYYEDVGSGPAVVFVHGAGGNHGSWFQQVAFFGTSRRCLTFDVRGFGNSSAPTGEPAASLADDLISVIDVLGLDRVLAIGQSAGGIPVLGAALARPSLFRGIVLAGSIGSVDDARLREQIQEHRAAVGRRPASYAAAWARDNPQAVEQFDAIRAASRPPDRRVAAEPSSRQRTTLAGLSRLQVPTLFVVGELDELVPLDVVRLVANSAGATVEVMADAGHSTYFEQPDRFNRLVADFDACLGLGA